MSVPDLVTEAICATFEQGKPTGITVNEIGRLTIWASARSTDSHLMYDPATATWFYMNLPVTIDPRQTEPWTVQHDGRYASAANFTLADYLSVENGAEPIRPIK